MKEIFTSLIHAWRVRQRTLAHKQRNINDVFQSSRSHVTTRLVIPIRQCLYNKRANMEKMRTKDGGAKGRKTSRAWVQYRSIDGLKRKTSDGGVVAREWKWKDVFERLHGWHFSLGWTHWLRSHLSSPLTHWHGETKCPSFSRSVYFSFSTATRPNLAFARISFLLPLQLYFCQKHLFSFRKESK